MIKFLKWLLLCSLAGSLLITGFLIAPSFISHINDQQARTIKKALIRKLDYIQPSFEPLILVAQGRTSLSPSEWEIYLSYYTAIIDALPDVSQAYLLAGYCYYHLEKTDTAIAFFEKSASIERRLFWNYYNLGILFLRKSLLPQAALALNLAVNIPVSDSLEAMFVSKIYADFSTHSSFREQSIDNLTKGYQTAYSLLALINNIAKNPSDAANLLQLKRALSVLSPRYF